MKILKVLNNNAAITLNENGQEIVVMGSGIAFQKKKDDFIDKEKVERIFSAENKEVSSRVLKMADTISMEYFDVSEEIYRYSQGVLGVEINESVIFTLADHISFAVERLKIGMDITNPLVWEVKRYYIDEYKVGKDALNIIENKFKVKLPDDEAASIALHIVNARVDKSISEVVKIIKILQDLLNIVKYHYKIDFDDEIIAYQRMVTHLKFFAQRIVIGQNLDDDSDQLHDMIKGQYPEAYKCASKIKDYVLDSYKFKVSNSELTFLTVHIERVVNSVNGNN